MTEVAGVQPTATPGKQVGVDSGRQSSRLVVFLHAVAFVLGFAAVFTLIGSAAGLIGQSLNAYLPIIQRFGAILLVIFGLTTLGVFRWLVSKIEASTDVNTNPAAAGLVSLLQFFNTLLYTERRVTEMHQVNRSWGYLSSVMLGISFSAGWVPCVGPILASIFFLAQNSATVSQGAGLLAVYSLGLGIPFLITGAAFSRASRFLRRLNRHAGIVSIISGIFLLYVAYMLWSDSLALLTTRFYFLNDWVFALEDKLALSSGTGGDIIGVGFLTGAPLAFAAGLISFISPCVLPLVPAYIGYLSGAALSGSSKA
ncbi:MAG: cytochrome c biogenesis protein CcdA [Caldilineaceae bacterium]